MFEYTKYWCCCCATGKTNRTYHSHNQFFFHNCLKQKAIWRSKISKAVLWHISKYKLLFHSNHSSQRVFITLLYFYIVFWGFIDLFVKIVGLQFLRSLGFFKCTNCCAHIKLLMQWGGKSGEISSI